MTMNVKELRKRLEDVEQDYPGTEVRITGDPPYGPLLKTEYMEQENWVVLYQ